MLLRSSRVRCRAGGLGVRVGRALTKATGRADVRIVQGPILHDPQIAQNPAYRPRGRLSGRARLTDDWHDPHSPGVAVANGTPPERGRELSGKVQSQNLVFVSESRTPRTARYTPQTIARTEPELETLAVASVIRQPSGRIPERGATTLLRFDGRFGSLTADCSSLLCSVATSRQTQHRRAQPRR